MANKCEHDFIIALVRKCRSTYLDILVRACVRTYLDIGDTRQRHPDADGMCGDGEHGHDAERDASWYGVHVDPEGDPGEHDDEHGGDVVLEQEVAILALEEEAGGEAGEVTCGNRATRHVKLPAGTDQSDT